MLNRGKQIQNLSAFNLNPYYQIDVVNSIGDPESPKVNSYEIFFYIDNLILHPRATLSSLLDEMKDCY